MASRAWEELPLYQHHMQAVAFCKSRETKLFFWWQILSCKELWIHCWKVIWGWCNWHASETGCYDADAMLCEWPTVLVYFWVHFTLQSAAPCEAASVHAFKGSLTLHISFFAQYCFLWFTSKLMDTFQPTGLDLVLFWEVFTVDSCTRVVLENKGGRPWR